MIIDLVIPGLLADLTGGRRVVPLEAGTLAAAVDAIAVQYPALRPHVFDEDGALRAHVRIFFNGENLKWIADRGGALKHGDRLEILQAVSGG